MRWIFPIRLDEYGLALEGESLEALRDESGFDVEANESEQSLAWPAIRPALKECSPEALRQIIASLDHETLHFFSELLHENAEDAVRVVGSDKYAMICNEAFIRRLTHPQAKWKMTNLTGPKMLSALRKQWGTSYPAKPQVPYYKLAEAWEVTDKKVKQWDKRLAAAGPAPKDDGSEYFSNIADPPRKRKGGHTMT
jgi:hypothetical protein